jgi:hypothetical protein
MPGGFSHRELAQFLRWQVARCCAAHQSWSRCPDVIEQEYRQYHRPPKKIGVFVFAFAPANLLEYAIWILVTTDWQLTKQECWSVEWQGMLQSMFG